MSLIALPCTRSHSLRRGASDAHGLESVAKSRSRDAGREAQYVYNNVMLVAQKPAVRSVVLPISPVQDVAPKAFEPVDTDEVVLSVAFYHPTKRVKTQVHRVLRTFCVSSSPSLFRNS